VLAKGANLAKKGFDMADQAGFDTSSFETPQGLAGEFGQAFTSPTPAVTPATQPPGFMNAMAEAAPPQQDMITLTPGQLAEMIATASQRGAARRPRPRPRPKKTRRKQTKGKTMKKKVKA